MIDSPRGSLLLSLDLDKPCHWKSLNYTDSYPRAESENQAPSDIGWKRPQCQICQLVSCPVET